MIIKGNVNNEASEHRGWIMGHFMPDSSPFKTSNVEVKWGNHKAGDAKKSFAKNIKAQSLFILLKGKETFTFPDITITLDKEGDYIFYSAGVAHSWIADEACLNLIIRWP